MTAPAGPAAPVQATPPAAPPTPPPASPAPPAAPPVTPPAGPPPAADLPPWGAEEANFDATRAWQLIQNLRQEQTRLNARPVMTTEQQQQLTEYQALVDASKTDQQRKDEELQAATRDAETARSEALRYRIALEHGISQEDLTMLGTGTEEELTARAKWIADKNAAAAAATAPPAGSPPPAPRRPGEMLPGAAPPPPPPPVANDAYPSSWLTPTQRAALNTQT